MGEPWNHMGKSWEYMGKPTINGCFNGKLMGKPTINGCFNGRMMMGLILPNSPKTEAFLSTGDAV
jgi:hypothetical protein